MLCQCGFEIADDFKFCPLCGKKADFPPSDLKPREKVIFADRRYTIKTVISEYFRGEIGETKLRQMVRDGEIPHFRVGNRIFFHEEALNNWAAEQERLSVTKRKYFVR